MVAGRPGTQQDHSPVTAANDIVAEAIAEPKDASNVVEEGDNGPKPPKMDEQYH